ncbi:MAG TPA: fluoride efflux transporter CrcB [Nevskiaceae bacterium]|nr:fluoride efflux transporter CrcB [Nevskiaceae bacterium]
MSGNVILWLAVSLSGMLGCAARFGAVLAFKSLPYGFPFATLFVNVSGSFAMGAIMAHAHAREDFSEVLRLALTTGFLGGFTTFSAFSIETVLLWRDGQAAASIGNVVGNLVLSIVACALGYALLRPSAG